MHTIFVLFEPYELDTLYPARVRFETFSMYRTETLSTLCTPSSYRKLILVLDAKHLYCVILCRYMQWEREWHGCPGHGVLLSGFTKYSVWMAWHKDSSMTKTVSTCSVFIITCGKCIMIIESNSKYDHIAQGLLCETACKVRFYCWFPLTFLIIF